MNCMNSSWKKPQKGGCWGLFRTLLGKRVSKTVENLQESKVLKDAQGPQGLALTPHCEQTSCGNLKCSHSAIERRRGGSGRYQVGRLRRSAGGVAGRRAGGQQQRAVGGPAPYGRDDDTTIISAQVASASGIADYFETSVMFGDFESRIVDYECTCPAIARFDGLCKATAWPW